MKIGINCGHTLSGAGYGAVGLLNEVTEDRLVGKELMNLLKNTGHTVINCTVDSAETQQAYLARIVQIANGQNLDLFVSIHFNAGGGKGTEVFTHKGTRDSRAVAICSKMQGLGFVNRGIKDGSGLYVVNSTKATAMLVEVCFVDNQTDYGLYKSLGYKRVAQAIYEGITGTAIKVKEEEDMTEAEVKKIATQVANDLIYKYSDKVYNKVDEVPDWGRATVQKLINKGLLKGNEKGLDLSYTLLRLIVVNDRAGLYD